VTYKLSFTGDHEVNGNITKFVDNTSGYRAVLITTYRAGRPTQTPSGTVPATRTAIYPRYYRASAINIDTLLP
jgi:phage-related protein